MENRELDQWIAGHVMGLKFEGGQNKLFGPDCSIPSYSTDMAAAWQEVEKMESDGWLVHVGKIISEGFFRCDFATTELDDYGPVKSVYAESATAQLAICIAAKKAIEASY